MEGMEVETSLDVLSRAASLVETETETEIIKARPVDCFETKMESTFIPKPNTLLSKAMEFKEQEQSMEVEEGTINIKDQVVYRRRKMKCSATQTLTDEQPAFPPRPMSGPPPLLCVSPRSSMYEEIRPQQRTSVITSAHLQRRPHTIVGVPVGYNVLDLQISHRKDVKSLPISSGNADPVVDEHFRRSLGAEYADFTPPSGSVEDHFALSLGDECEDTKIPDEDDHIEIGKENDDICIHNKEDSALETYIKSLDCQVRLLVKEFTTNKTTVDKTLQDHSKVLNQLQNRETNSELDSLRKENLQLKKLNDEFSKRINNLSCILADLQDKAKSAEDEKASLITAIKLLYKENERNQEQSNVNQADQINSEEQQRQQHDPTWHQVNPNIQINNRFAGLSVEEHTEEVSMSCKSSNPNVNRNPSEGELESFS
ncbi:transcription cofactor vestigial 4 isoform X2 [Paramuricea clavata]|uniref:Transcription cofactor vestigial 4 isoform X2 n=1 Tax=Paramuricea clavata TaxID=317549 RepID=A0A7D9L3J7_PARCT|nr:transcription cofactor vestigial 4 isoform X2 [Paramuricea clavata]